MNLYMDEKGNLYKATVAKSPNDCMKGAVADEFMDKLEENIIINPRNAEILSEKIATGVAFPSEPTVIIVD